MPSVAKNIVETVLKARDEMSKELTRAQRNMIRLRTVGKVTFQALSGAAKAAWRAISGPLGQITALVGAVALPGTLVFGLNQARKELDELGKTADRINVSAEALSEFQFVAELTGVNVNTLNLGLQRMVRRISEAAAGTGEAQKAIRELGLDAQTLNRLQADEQFKTIADAMEDVRSESDKLRLATKLFDSEGARLVVTLKAGRAEIERLQETARKYGLSLSREQIASVERFNDAMTELRAVFKGIFRLAIVELAPALERITLTMTEVTSDRLLKGVAALSQTMLGLAEGLVIAAQAGNETFRFFRDFADSFSYWSADAVGDTKTRDAAAERLSYRDESLKKSLKQLRGFISEARNIASDFDREVSGVADNAARRVRFEHFYSSVERALEEPLEHFRQTAYLEKLRERLRDRDPTYRELVDIQRLTSWQNRTYEGRRAYTQRYLQQLRASQADQPGPVESALQDFNQVGQFRLINQVGGAITQAYRSIQGSITDATGAVGEWAEKNREAREIAVQEAERTRAEIERRFQEINSIVLAVGDTFEHSLVRTFDSVIDGTFRARDAIRDFGREVLRTFARLGARSFTSAIFGGGPDQPGLIQGVVRTLLSARGNAFDSGQVVQRFARGGLPQGIVTQPTAFHMGLMGEGARDEAIVPLGRMRNGDLGIRASGMGGGGGLTLVINGNVQTWGPQQFADYFFAALRSPEAARTIDSQQSLSRRTRPGVR